MATGDPDASRTRFLAVSDGRLAFDDTGGDGPLVLAIPGMGDLRSEYRKLRPALQQAGYRVVTMDVRGFGETSAHWGDYTARAIGRDALAILDHLGAGSACILGNSFAAGAALWAAHDAPERVEGVVLLGPIVRDQKVSGLASLALRIGFAGSWRVWFWTTYWDSLFPARKPGDHAEAKAALRRNLREPGRMAALRSMVGLSKAGVPESCRRRTHPRQMWRRPDCRQTRKNNRRWAFEWRHGPGRPVLAEPFHRKADGDDRWVFSQRRSKRWMTCSCIRCRTSTTPKTRSPRTCRR